MTKSIAKKSTTGSLPPAVPLAITPMFSPWTHTSDDSYIYQLSLVLATATVSYEFSVERLVFLSFRGYLGEIESGKKKAKNFSYTFFCICSVVSGLALPIFKS